MIQKLIGQKIDQTQKFLENGKRIPVTLIRVTDNAVVQIKTAEKDAYDAVQLGFGIKKNVDKPQAGHSSKAGLKTSSVLLREVRVTDGDDVPVVGSSIAVGSVFKPGDIVAVTGTSKGKGFAGVVKRHGFRGGPKTHGQSDRHRAPGSIGQTTTPGRVYRGKRMAGRMGSDTVTVANLMVVAIDEVNKVLYVAGLVPGHKASLLTIEKTGEVKNVVPLLNGPEEPVVEKGEEAAPIATEEITQKISIDKEKLESVDTEEVKLEEAVEKVRAQEVQQEEKK